MYPLPGPETAGQCTLKFIQIKFFRNINFIFRLFAVPSSSLTGTYSLFAFHLPQLFSENNLPAERRQAKTFLPIVPRIVSRTTLPNPCRQDSIFMTGLRVRPITMYIFEGYTHLVRMADRH